MTKFLKPGPDPINPLRGATFLEKWINSGMLTKDCWHVQVWGYAVCRECQYLATEDCGGYNIRHAMLRGEYPIEGLPDVRGYRDGRIFVMRTEGGDGMSAHFPDWVAKDRSNYTIKGFGIGSRVRLYKPYSGEVDPRVFTVEDIQPSEDFAIIFGTFEDGQKYSTLETDVYEVLDMGKARKRKTGRKAKRTK